MLKGWIRRTLVDRLEALGEVAVGDLAREPLGEVCPPLLGCRRRASRLGLGREAGSLVVQWCGRHA